MDQIFTKNEKEFAKILCEVESEATAAEEENSFMPNKPALKMLVDIFCYIKTQNEAYWNLSEIIHCLESIVSTGEYKYLYRNHLVRYSYFQFVSDKKDRNGMQAAKDMLYAGRWIYFYARKNTVEDGGQVKISKAMMRLELALAMWKREHLQLLEKELQDIQIEEEKRTARREKDFPIRLYQHLDKYVVGQDDVKKALAMAVYRFVKYGERNPLLMMGPTGSGKNYLMETLASFSELEEEVIVFTYDASGITPNGFKGNEVGDIFEKFSRVCAESGKEGRKGIIYLDEVDKIMMPNMDSNHEDINEIVQHQLLSAIAGTSIIGDVNTKDILFVLGGAFTKMEEIKKEQHKNVIGFGKKASGYEIWGQDELTLRDDLIAYGAKREFLGRISNIVCLDRLSKEELRRVLMHKETSIINRKKEFFREEGLVLEFEDEFIDDIVEKVYKENLGARSVTNVVEALLGTYDFDMLMNGYTKMTVHSGMLRGEKPHFEKKERRRRVS